MAETRERMRLLPVIISRSAVDAQNCSDRGALLSSTPLAVVKVRIEAGNSESGFRGHQPAWWSQKERRCASFLWLWNASIRIIKKRKKRWGREGGKSKGRKRGREENRRVTQFSFHSIRTRISHSCRCNSLSSRWRILRSFFFFFSKRERERFKKRHSEVNNRFSFIIFYNIVQKVKSVYIWFCYSDWNVHF